MNRVSDELYRQFCTFLASHSGIVLGDNKQYLVKSRLSPLMAQFALPDLTTLLSKAMTGKERDLKNAVVEAMTTNETLWFRDGYPFEQLSQLLLPELGKKGRPMRIWSAAASSGQEAYSIAMIALEQQIKKPGSLPAGVQIVGTDISLSMIQQCKEGVYDSLALARGLSAERKKMFFEPLDGQRMRVSERVRKLTTFRYLNLLESYSLLGKFDIIFCRNVLIYFAPEVKAKILNQFATSLAPGGYLILGASESLTGLTDKFEMIRANPGILYRLKAAS